jgi:hypothetical protein
MLGTQEIVTSLSFFYSGRYTENKAWHICIHSLSGRYSYTEHKYCMLVTQEIVTSLSFSDHGRYNRCKAWRVRYTGNCDHFH